MRALPLALQTIAAVASLGCTAPRAATPPPRATPAVATPDPGAPPLAPPPAASGCGDDLRAAVGFTGLLEDKTAALFLFEARVDDAASRKALPFRASPDPNFKDVSRPIPPDLAHRLGAPSDDREVAVYPESGAPACVGRPGGYFAVLRHEAWYPPYIEVQRQIEGCSPPRDGGTFPAPVHMARSAKALVQCAFQAAKRIATETFQWPEGGVFDAPPPSIENGLLPTEFEALAPPGPCYRPNCVRGYALRGVEMKTGQSFYELTLSRVRPKEGKAYCSLAQAMRCQNFSSMVLRPAAGAPLALWQGKDLDGLFTDARGARLIVSMGSQRTLVTYRPRPEGSPEEVQSILWSPGHVEDTEFEPHSFCPACPP